MMPKKKCKRKKNTEKKKKEYYCSYSKDENTKMQTWENKWLSQIIITVIIPKIPVKKNEAQRGEFSNWPKVTKSINAKSII